MLSGSAPDESVVSDQRPVTSENPEYEVPLPDKNYFRIEHRGDVHEPNRWLVKFQVPPPDWPGAVQATMHTMLELRGVDVPTSRVDWDETVLAGEQAACPERGRGVVCLGDSVEDGGIVGGESRSDRRRHGGFGRCVLQAGRCNGGHGGGDDRDGACQTGDGRRRV